MKSRQITFIDGKATREAIEKITGTKKGLVKICKSKGLPQSTLSRICINGYGDPKIIDRYIEAGIPIIRSNKPIPSRASKEYTRAWRKAKDPQTTMPEVPAEELKGIISPTALVPTSEIMKAVQTFPKIEIPVPPKQLTIEDLTQAEQIKALLITHYTSLIEDLKKL